MNGDSYICPSIAKYIQSHKGDVWRSEQQVGRLSIEMKLWIVPSDFPNEPISLPKIGEYIVSVVSWIQTLRWSSQKLRRLKIELYLTPHKKIWCQSQTSTIDRCHMNSGETEFFGNTAASISIWRREDMSKVLIHELLHAFDWDRLLPLSVRHNTITKTHEAESVVEALANIFQSLLFSYGDHNRFRANRALERERALATVLELNARQWTTTETHVREYCIIKAALMCNESAFRKFWSWISLPTAKDCQSNWIDVRKFCERELQSVISRFRSSVSPLRNTDCVSLQLVTQQLSLSPTRWND